MKVALNTFARSGIEARSGCDLVAGVQAALREYARCLRSGRKVPEFPRFLRESPMTPMTRSEVNLELSVDPEIEEALEQEARESQGVSVEQLAGHAVLVYLADLDRAAAPEQCGALLRPRRPLARL